MLYEVHNRKYQAIGRKTAIAAAVLCLALLAAGCRGLAPSTDINPENAAADRVWTPVSDDISRYECGPEDCGARLIVYRFTKGDFSWHFANKQLPGTVESWSRSLPHAAFVANGVYFNEKWQPTGLLKTKGATVNGNTYDYDRSGVLLLSPSPQIVDTATKGVDLDRATEAAQSFPLLVKNGSPVTSFKDTHVARRTFFGTDTDGNVYVGAVPEDGITFTDLARRLNETGVKWDNVINLDGGTSTGFAIRTNGFSETMNSILQVPNVIYAERK